MGLDFSPNGQYIAIVYGQTVVIRSLRDGFSKAFDLKFPWSIRFSNDGRYIAMGGDPQIWIWNVRMDKCVAMQRKHTDVVRGLVFTADGKGLLSASWDKMIIHWDASLVNEDNKDDETEAVSTQDFGGLREISRFVGHQVRQLPSLFPVSPLTDSRFCALGLCLRRFYISRWQLDCIWFMG